MAKAPSPSLVTLASVVVALALLGVAGLLGPRFSAHTPRVRYLAELDATTVVPNPADDAWPSIQRVLVNLRGRLPHGASPESNWQGFIDANRDAIAALSEATRRPRFGHPYDPERLRQGWATACAEADDPAMATRRFHDRLQPFPGPPIHVWHASTIRLDETRFLVNLLGAAAREAALRGELEEALDRAIAAHALGRHVFRRPMLVDQAVGAALLSIAHSNARRLLWRHAEEWSVEQLERLANSPVCTMSHPHLRESLAGEWRFILDLVDTAFTNDGLGDGALRLPGAIRMYNSSARDGLAEQLGMTVRRLFHAGRRETLRAFEQLFMLTIEVALDPSREEELEEISARLGEVRHELVLAADTRRTILSVQRVRYETEVKQDATSAVIGLLRYRKDHGAWPASLDELLPTYVDAAPRDVERGTFLDYEPPAAEGALPRLVSRRLPLDEEGVPATR